jgi:hypothetical protein
LTSLIPKGSGSIEFRGMNKLKESSLPTIMPMYLAELPFDLFSSPRIVTIQASDAIY